MTKFNEKKNQKSPVLTYRNPEGITEQMKARIIWPALNKKIDQIISTLQKKSPIHLSDS